MKKIILWLLRRLSRLLCMNEKIFLLFKDEALMNSSEHLIRLSKLIRRNVFNRSGMLIIDIGAASGDSPVFFSKNFPECKIIGFEPIPESFALARDKTAKIASIELRNLALYDHPGEMDFHITTNKVSSSLNAPDHTVSSSSGAGLFDNIEIKKVKVSTLDLELQGTKEILLIKLDTQGSELGVLKGGVATLKRTNFVISEMNNHDDYKNASKYYEVDAFLRANNFILADIIVAHRSDGRVIEYDAIYMNRKLLNSQ